MKKATISKSNLQFLCNLRDNNNRVWFAEHKDRYLDAHENMIAFADGVLNAMTEYDHIVQQTGKKCLYRIYRDVRFSKDKSPYKSSWGVGMKRATVRLRGGYYYHIEPGGSFVAGGFWGPNSEDLLRIRQELAADSEPLRKIIAQPLFQEYFGELRGKTLKTAPRGFAKDHPNIDLLRYKQFLVKRNFSDKEVLSKNFQDEVVKTFRAMRPYFDFMSETLTTDLNGVTVL